MNYKYTSIVDRNTNNFTEIRRNLDKEDDDIEVSIIDDGQFRYAAMEVNFKSFPFENERESTQEAFEKHFHYAKQLINGIEL